MVEDIYVVFSGGNIDERYYVLEVVMVLEEIVKKETTTIGNELSHMNVDHFLEVVLFILILDTNYTCI